MFSHDRKYNKRRTIKRLTPKPLIDSSESQSGTLQTVGYNDNVHEHIQGESTPIQLFEERMKQISKESLDSLYEEINKIHYSLEHKENPTTVSPEVQPTMKKPSKGHVYHVQPSSRTRNLISSREHKNLVNKKPETVGEQAKILTEPANSPATKSKSTTKRRSNLKGKLKDQMNLSPEKPQQDYTESPHNPSLSTGQYTPKMVTVWIHTKHHSYKIRKYQELPKSQRAKLTHNELNSLFQGKDPFNLLQID